MHDKGERAWALYERSRQDVDAVLQCIYASGFRMHAENLGGNLSNPSSQ